MSKRGENIYKRKDGRWEGRYIKCRTLHGRIQYGYVYGKSYSAVKSKLKETASRPIQTSDSRGTQPTSYSEILKMWLLSAKNHVKESTFSRYNHLVERHIQPFLGDYQIGEISNALLEKYIDHLLQCGRLDGSGGLSPKSVSDILVVIKRSMRYAQENNHLVICSTAGLSVKRSRNNMRVLSKIEQRQLEYVLMQDMDLTKFTVLLCLYTGIRIGEACALKWEHIRLDSGILEVRETMQRIQAPQNMASKTRIIITEPKSASSNRDIPLPRFLMQYAVQFQADRNAFVLTGEKNQFIEPRTLQNRFRNYVKTSGIEHANYHALRHKYAKRKAVETIEATARQAALQRALLGEVVSETDYHALCNQLIEASTVLSQDNQNRQWLKGRLNDTLIDLKYSAGLSNELSESIARKLCERSKKLDENHINMNSAF